jgi:hypothetical protein
MYCRFCGAQTPDDSRFCPKCGKRIEDAAPRPESPPHRFGWRTPYPWAAILIVLFLSWAFYPRNAGDFDYASVELGIELDGRSSAPEQSLYRHHFSFVVENVGEAPIVEVPVELRAEVEAEGPVSVESEFLGRRLILVSEGRVDPLVVILSDDLAPGDKRRYPADGIVTGTPPFSVRYELIDPESKQVLAEVTVGEPPSEPPSGEPSGESGQVVRR